MSLNPRCCHKTKVTKIKMEQLGRRAVILNAAKREHIKIEVDNCVLCNQLAADYVLARIDVGDIIIELKGKDVEHAVKQVHATAEYWQKNGYRQGKIAGLIVSTQYRKANTAVRKAQEEFAKRYKSPLHVVTKNYEGVAEAIFSFKGPHSV